MILDRLTSSPNSQLLLRAIARTLSQDHQNGAELRFALHKLCTSTNRPLFVQMATAERENRPATSLVHLLTFLPFDPSALLSFAADAFRFAAAVSFADQSSSDRSSRTKTCQPAVTERDLNRQCRPFAQYESRDNLRSGGRKPASEGEKRERSE